MLALKHLWPDGPRHVTIIGNGTQTRAHAQALRDLYPYTLRIDVIGHTTHKAEAFCSGHAALALQPADHVADACDLAHRLITGTQNGYEEARRPVGDHVIEVTERARKMLQSKGAAKALLLATIGAIHQLWRNGYIEADFKAEQDRVLAAIVRAQQFEESEDRPEFESDIPEPEEDEDPDVPSTVDRPGQGRHTVPR